MSGGGAAVVELCAEAAAAELAGRLDDARRLAGEAWGARADDVDACIAAHYVARYQLSLGEALVWHRRALRLARTSGDPRVAAFFPALYLGVGRCYEELGRVEEARRHYALGASVDGPGAEVLDGYRALARRRMAALADDPALRLPPRRPDAGGRP